MGANIEIGSEASRVVLAVAASSRDDAALDIIHCLGGDDGPEVSGLIVEETRALGHAESRLAREVVLSGGERPLEIAALTRQLRAQAEAARERFAARALKLGIRSRWELAHGDLLPVLARLGAHAETLAVGESADFEDIETRWLAATRELLTAPARALLLARQGWSTGTGILALVHDSDSVESLVETARRLAARSGSRLHLRVAASQDEAGEAALQRLRALQQSLTATRPALSVTIDRCRFDAVASAARQARARLIIMPWLEEADTAESLKSIVRATRSAVLLVK